MPKADNKKLIFTLAEPWYYKKEDGKFGRIRLLKFSDTPASYIKEGVVYVNLDNTDLDRVFVPIKETPQEFFKITINDTDRENQSRD